MKKVISIFLALAICMSFGTAAFADSDDFSSEDVIEVNEGQARFIRTATKYISSHAGIRITVTYTFNDSDGSITGLQSATITSCPAGIYSANITNRTVANEYILLQLTYWEDGVCKSDSAYCYAG